MKRALVVDDDEGIRKIIGYTLKCLGFDVEYAAHGQDAADKAATTVFMLITMDMKMPVLNGEQAISVIRANEAASNISPVACIIAISSDESSKSRMLEAGADIFVLKPFSIEQLVSVVNRKCKERE